MAIRYMHYNVIMHTVLLFIRVCLIFSATFIFAAVGKDMNDSYTAETELRSPMESKMPVNFEIPWDIILSGLGGGFAAVTGLAVGGGFPVVEGKSRSPGLLEALTAR